MAISKPIINNIHGVATQNSPVSVAVDITPKSIPGDLNNMSAEANLGWNNDGSTPQFKQSVVDVAGTMIGTDTTAQQEILRLSHTTASGVIVPTDAIAELNLAAYSGTSGTSEGVVVAVGEEADIICAQFQADGTTPRLSGAATVAADGMYALSIAETGFNAGRTVADRSLDLNGTSNSVTHLAADTYSWPTGDISTGLNSDWDYTAGTGSGDFSVFAKIVNNTGFAIDFSGATVSVTLNITSLPVGGTIDLVVFTVTPAGSLAELTQTITSTGSVTLTGTNTDSSFVVFSPAEILLSVSVATAAEKPFTYQVTDVQIDLLATSSLAYSIDLDTADAVLTGTATGSASNGATLDTFMGEIYSAVTTQYPTVTAGSVVTSDIETTATGTGNDNRDTSSFINGRDWDVRQTSTLNSTTVSYSDWDGWNGKSIQVGIYVVGSWINTDFGDLWSSAVGIAGLTLVVTDSGDSGNTATFSVTPGYVSDITARMQFKIDSITSQSGTPPTSFTGTDGWIYTLTASPSYKTVIFDTNQTGTELVPAATYTNNTGNVGINSTSNTFGSLDTFTLTLDSSHAASPITGTYSSQAGYIQRATEVEAAVNAATTTNLTVVRTDGVVAIDSSTVGDRTDASFLVVAGTGSTTSDTVTVQVQGVDGVGRSATVMNLLNADTTNGHTLASYSATIANAVSGVELGYHAQLGYIAVGNYSTTTPSTTSFNALSEMAGAESNISLTFTPGTKVDGTVADVNITNTVVIEGADAFNTGSLTIVDYNIMGENYPITFPGDTSINDQAALVKATTASSTLFGTTVTDGVVTATAVSPGDVPDTTTVLTNAGTPSGDAYVVPSVNVLQTGTAGLSVFTITITGGGITGSVVYQAFADTKAELVTALQGAVDANSGVHTYNDYC